MISAVEKRTVKEIKDFLEDMEKKATELSATMSQFKRRFGDRFTHEIYQALELLSHRDLEKSKITEKMANEYFYEIFVSDSYSDFNEKFTKACNAVEMVIWYSNHSAENLKSFVNALVELKAILSKLEPPASETGPITLMGKMVMVSRASSSAEESQAPEAGAKINQ